MSDAPAPRPPIPDAYLVPGTRLVAGEYPGCPPDDPAAALEAKLARFLDEGVTAFVDLTDPADGLAPYEDALRALAERRGARVAYERLTIRDMDVCEPAHMRRVLDAVDARLADGHAVYVHCWGGIGRTGMTVGCWLVRHGMDGEAALAEVARLFGTMSAAKVRRHGAWGSPQTPAQRRVVRAWAAHEGAARASATREGDAYDGARDAADRRRGVLLGLAAGDALGTTLEFRPRGTFEPIADMVGGGPFRLAPGQWTDDTSMAMCLAEALLDGDRDAGEDDADAWRLDAMRRFVRWYRDGEWSSTGSCFDIGNTTRAAIERFERDGDPAAGSDDPREAGNGSLMRVGAVALRWRGDWARAVEAAGESSRLTHAAPEAVDACRYFVGLLVGALAGEGRDALLGGGPYAPAAHAGYWERAGLAPAIARIAAGSFREKPRAAIRASGYVVHTLEAALWALWHAADFRAGALAAVNLGEDADTTGAVYGQLAGGLFGASGIPAGWVDRLARRDEIERVIARFG